MLSHVFFIIVISILRFIRKIFVPDISQYFQGFGWKFIIFQGIYILRPVVIDFLCLLCDLGNNHPTSTLTALLFAILANLEYSIFKTDAFIKIYLKIVPPKSILFFLFFFLIVGFLYRLLHLNHILFSLFLFVHFIIKIF